MRRCDSIILCSVLVYVPFKKKATLLFRWCLSYMTHYASTGHGPPNAEGVAFYNKLIDCLLEHGIEPYVTLYHWDLPIHLQNEFGGWLDYQIVPAFAEYGKLCMHALIVNQRSTCKAFIVLASCALYSCSCRWVMLLRCY
jgi:beta-glucosidase/6-phospho-beta-glucosidase/beta-galactosidase